MLRTKLRSWNAGLALTKQTAQLLHGTLHEPWSPVLPITWFSSLNSSLSRKTVVQPSPRYGSVSFTSPVGLLGTPVVWWFILLLTMFTRTGLVGSWTKSISWRPELNNWIGRASSRKLGRSVRGASITNFSAQSVFATLQTLLSDRPDAILCPKYRGE